MQLLGFDFSAYQDSILIVLNLVLIESLLSVDNAVVLAAMVVDLPFKKRGKALKYGIIGAYALRGLSLVFAAELIQLSFLKLLGGLYLFWLAISYFTKSEGNEGQSDLDKTKNPIYRFFLNKIGPFWTTVVLIEFMDLSFSIDNVFAAVAFTDNIILICIGVFIGILAMRFAAQFFVKLIEQFPFLESISFIVIGILGFKLSLSYISEFFVGNIYFEFINSHKFDAIMSLVTMLVFLVPVLSSLFFNFPSNTRKKKILEEEEVA